jgi:hypothetical protein
MRYLFMFLFVATSVWAQNEPENWASVRLICQTETHYRIEVEAFGDVETVYIGLDIEDAIVWNVNGAKTAQFDVLIGNGSVRLNTGAFMADSLVLSETRSCENAPKSDYDFVLDALREVSELLEGIR